MRIIVKYMINDNNNNNDKKVLLKVDKKFKYII